MTRLEGYRAAMLAGVLAIIVSPGNIVGLPVGLWALVTMGRRDVRMAFGLDHAKPLHAVRWRWVVGALIVLALLVFLTVPRPSKEPNLLVSGTVTDAVTGKPIAGARVADNRYGATPNRAPQEAWTR